MGNPKLRAITIGVSVSESEDSAGIGFSTREVTRASARIAEIMTQQGVGLAFGHDWRSDGVMESIHAFAKRYSEVTPPLTNLLAWPLRPSLSASELAALSTSLRVVPTGLPPDITVSMSRSSAARPYLVARSLTHMRHCLTRAIDAQICIGGRRSGFKGRWPGVLEEAYLTTKARKPLFVSAVFGGVSQDIADVLLGRPGRSVCVPEDVKSAYRRYARPGNRADLRPGVEPVIQHFRSLGLRGVAARNHLSVDENRRLLRANSLDEVAALVLRGIARMRAR